MKLLLFENLTQAKALATKLGKPKEEIEKLKQYITTGANQSQGQIRVQSFAGPASKWLWEENIEGNDITNIVIRLSALGIGFTGVNGLNFAQVTKLVTDLEKRAELEKTIIPGLIFLGEITDGVDKYYVHRVDEYNAVLKVGSPAWCLKTKSHWNDYKAKGYIFVISRAGLDLDVPSTYTGVDKYESPNMTWRYGITVNRAGDVVHAHDDNNTECAKFFKYDGKTRGITFLLNNFNVLVKESILAEIGKGIIWTGWNGTTYQADFDKTNKSVIITDSFGYTVNIKEKIENTILEWEGSDSMTAERSISIENEHLNNVKDWFKLLGFTFNLKACSTHAILPPTSIGRVKGVPAYNLILPDPIRLAGEDNGAHDDIVCKISDYGTILDLKTTVPLDVDIHGSEVIRYSLLETNKVTNKQILSTWAAFDKAVVIAFLGSNKVDVYSLIFKGDDIWLEKDVVSTVAESKDEIKAYLSKNTTCYAQLKESNFDAVWDIAIKSAKQGFIDEA
jgi:hypothetical protein